VFKGFIFDLDGTVYLGERLIPGAEQVVRIAFQAIKQGAHFIATNPDRTCPVEGGELPDCAGVIAALEAVTLKKVEVIVGKPSPITVQVALEVMGLGPADCILIGDRLETDICMGVESGMKTALVMTGVTDAKTLEASPVRPDYVFQSIADLEGLFWDHRKS